MGKRTRRSIVLATGLLTAAAGLGLAAAAPSGAQAVPPPYLEVSPASGPTGTSIQIDGFLYCPDVPVGGDILLVFVDPREGFQTQAALPTAAKQDDHTFSVTATVPAVLSQLVPGVGTSDFPVVPGDHDIRASCSQSSATVVPTFNGSFLVTETTTTTAAPTTTTTTEPAFVPPAEPPADAADFEGTLPGDTTPGGTVVIAEPGFEPGETVVVVLYSDPKVLASVEADVNGEVRIAVALPSDTTPGAHTLVLFGETQVRKAPLNVLALPAQVPGSTAATLPRTGPDRATGTSTGVAAVLLVVGSALVVLSSRRRAGA